MPALGAVGSLAEAVGAQVQGAASELFRMLPVVGGHQSAKLGADEEVDGDKEVKVMRGEGGITAKLKLSSPVLGLKKLFSQVCICCQYGVDILQEDVDAGASYILSVCSRTDAGVRCMRRADACCVAVDVGASYIQTCSVYVSMPVMPLLCLSRLHLLGRVRNCA